MDRFLHLIVNKQSRNGDSVFKKLLVEIPRYTQQFKIYSTNNTSELEVIVKDLKESMPLDDLVIIIGGDGSLNQIITLFEKYNIENDLGYIPSGSGNDFARSHKMPIDTDEAIKYLFKLNEPRELSIIHATQGEKEYYAVNSIGIGIDGLVIHQTENSRFKKIFGPASYISSVLSAFVKQKKFPVTIRVDDGTFTFDKVQLALFANNAYFGGGIEIIPEADGTDDTLEIIIADNVNGQDLLKILRRLFKNGSHLSHPKLHSFSSKKITFFSEAKQFGQKDGESFNQEGFALTFSTKKRSFWI